MPAPAIDASKAALLMIDFQRDFCEKGGYADTAWGELGWVEEVIPQAAELLAACRAAGLLVIHTREGYASDLSDLGPVKLRRSQAAGATIGDAGPMGRLLIRGEHGQDTIDRLAAQEGESVLDKSTYGAFASTRLLEILRERNIEQLVFAGVTADVCVHTTLREAIDRGFDCFYCRDAISTPDAAIREACEKMVEHEGGIWGWLCTAVEVAELMQAPAAGVEPS